MVKRFMKRMRKHVKRARKHPMMQKMSKTPRSMMKHLKRPLKAMENPMKRAAHWARRNTMHGALLLTAVVAAGSLSYVNSSDLKTDVTDYCLDTMDMVYTEYDHYGGYPDQCDCDGNCWDANGCWYSDTNNPSDGTAGVVDCHGSRWNNYGLIEEDVFCPYEHTASSCDSFGPDGDADEPFCNDGECDNSAIFWDVPPSDYYYPFVQYVGQEGIFDGYGDGSFKPETLINRVETAKVVLEAFDYPIGPNPGWNLGFKDLDITQWYMPYVEVTNQLGIMTGDTAGTMRPSSTVSRGEMFRIFLEAADVPVGECVYGAAMDVVAEDWHCKYLQFGVANGLLVADTSESTLGYLYPGMPMTRGDVAELFYNYRYSYLVVQ